jgi:hypothetical protein
MIVIVMKIYIVILSFVEEACQAIVQLMQSVYFTYRPQDNIKISILLIILINYLM